MVPKRWLDWPLQGLSGPKYNDPDLDLGVHRAQVLDTLVEIQERHAAVRELERSLLDLHQVFLDMAVLVEAQGEMLDNIESQARSLRLGLDPR